MPSVRKLKAKNGEEPLEKLPNGRIVWARNAKGEPVCNSPMREKPGKRCKRTIDLFKNGRCNLHGGKSPAGFDSPSFTHGLQSRYADVLPDSMRAEYQALLKQPDYTSLRNEIVLTVVRLREQYKQYGTIDPETFENLCARGQYAQELLAGEYDSDEVEEALREIVTLVNTLAEKVNADSSIQKAQEHLRRLAETENKKLSADAQAIPAKQATALFNYLDGSVKGHCRFLRKWLKENHPEVLQDPLFPDPLKLIGMDMDSILPQEHRIAHAEIIDVTDSSTVTDLVRV